jgi:translocation and assembly module TamA
LGWALAGALSGIGSDTSFFKFDVSAAHYRPLGSAGLLYLRGKMGQVWARDRDEVPTDWLFKTGGAGSVRGYGYQALGVRSHGAVVGGRVLAWGSVEYQHRLVPGWRGAVFLDVGNATDRWSDFRVRRGYGVGLRWITPVGLLAFDLARGDDRSRPRLHFSLGVNF